jgi:hypothetical protein
MTSYPFTYHQEIGHQGQSLVPHYPGGRSGVTIGPGYDMGQRSPQEIYNDLTSAGIDAETAYSLIDAAHKTGTDAGSWIAQRGGIIITEEQQRALFENVLVPQYEERTKTQLNEFLNTYDGVSDEISWDTLSAKQREILFDYVYNTGSLTRFPELITAVLHEDWAEASLHYERFSDDQPLAYRNEMFFREFLDPDYTRNEVEAPSVMNDTSEVTENFFAEGLNDLYRDDADTSPSNDTDDWYENS